MSKLLELALASLKDLVPKYDLSILDKYPHNKIHIHGAGKTAPRMASELVELGINAAPLVIGLHGGHPLPNGESIAGAKLLLEAAKKLSSDDLVLFCLSGGASSLIELPIDGVSLEKLRKIYKDLIYSEKSIGEINNERKKISQIKEGKLGEAYLPAHVHCFIESDVEGDNPYDVGSSPILSLENPHTYQLVLKKQDLLDKLPEHFYKREINGQIKDNISMHLDLLKEHSHLATAGEVHLKVLKEGRGGRNTHWAAMMAIELIKKRESFELLSLASDGRDGATDAAGAYVDENVPIEELIRGVHEFDTYSTFERLGRLIKTGPTQYNLNDLRLITLNKK